MTEPSAAGLLAALEKLPATAAVSYRGLPGDAAAPAGTFVTEGFTATSRDPRIATENFAAGSIVAIAGRTGRDISFMAKNPDESEIVLLPGAILRPVQITHADGITVHVIEELLTDETAQPDPALPQTPDALLELVTDAVATARTASPAAITTPGKFSGSLR